MRDHGRKPSPVAALLALSSWWGCVIARLPGAASAAPTQRLRDPEAPHCGPRSENIVIIRREIRLPAPDHPAHPGALSHASDLLLRLGASAITPRNAGLDVTLDDGSVQGFSPGDLLVLSAEFHSGRLAPWWPFWAGMEVK